MLLPWSHSISQTGPLRYFGNTGFIIDKDSGEPVHFPVPAWATISALEVDQSAEGQATVTVEMCAPLPSSSVHQSALCIYFDAPDTQSSQDFALVYVIGKEVTKTTPALTHGRAMLVSLASKQVVSTPTVSVSGNNISLTFNTQSIGEPNPVIATSYYLPDGFESNLLSESVVSYFQQTPAPGNPGRPIRLPKLPPWAQEIDPSGTGYIEVPIQDEVPVRKNWPDFEDVDGDGRTDYDLGPDTSIGEGWLLGMWVRDVPGFADEYIAAIGRDVNQNGKLDANEIQFFVGQCPAPEGMDSCGDILREDGSFVVVWQVQVPTLNGGYLITCIYDSRKPIGERLKVYKKVGDGPGVLVWGPGDPRNYPWFNPTTRIR